MPILQGRAVKPSTARCPVRLINPPIHSRTRRGQMRTDRHQHPAFAAVQPPPRQPSLKSNAHSVLLGQTAANAFAAKYSLTIMITNNRNLLLFIFLCHLHFLKTRTSIETLPPLKKENLAVRFRALRNSACPTLPPIRKLRLISLSDKESSSPRLAASSSGGEEPCAPKFPTKIGAFSGDETNPWPSLLGTTDSSWAQKFTAGFAEAAPIGA